MTNSKGKAIIFGDEKIKFPMIIVVIPENQQEDEIIMNKRGGHLEIQSKLPITSFSETDIICKVMYREQ